MPADFPAFAMGTYKRKRKPYIHLSENKQETVELEDGRKVHILLENPATLKPAKAPLTDAQKHVRTVLGLVALFLLLTICMVCFLLDSL